MKPLKNILVLLCSLLLLSASCKKEKSKNPIDDLPPATQTGANTFGCLVNGEAFIPKGSGFGGPILSCQYEFVDKKYYFNLLAISNDKGCQSSAISLSLFNLILTKNTYVLEDFVENKAQSKYSKIIDCSLNDNIFKTSSNIKGELNITKYDIEKSIVSGTFSFDAVNAFGEKVEIREGRFDVKI